MSLFDSPKKDHFYDTTDTTVTPKTVYVQNPLARAAMSDEEKPEKCRKWTTFSHFSTSFMKITVFTHFRGFDHFGISL